MMFRVLGAVVAGSSLLAFAPEASALGFGGRASQMGDSWLNDAQKNPRFIEPGADNDPARYRASHPREGWYDRRRAQDRALRAPDRRRYGY